MKTILNEKQTVALNNVCISAVIIFTLIVAHLILNLIPNIIMYIVWLMSLSLTALAFYILNLKNENGNDSEKQ